VVQVPPDGSGDRRADMLERRTSDLVDRVNEVEVVGAQATARTADTLRVC